MFGLSTWEILIVLLMALVFIGPDQLPRVARKLGEGMRQVRGAMTRVDAEVRTAIREATAEDALAEEAELARKRAVENPMPAGAAASGAAAGSGLTLTPLHEHDVPGVGVVPSSPVATAHNVDPTGVGAPSALAAPVSAAPEPSQPDDEPVFEAESGGGVVVRRPPTHAVPRTPARRVVAAEVRPVADGQPDADPSAGPSA